MTSREEEILCTLCRKVRFFAQSQVAKTWWNGTLQGTRRARESMQRLAASGWLTTINVLARPFLNLECPLLCWEPGKPEPAFSVVSTLLSSRWRAPARGTQIILAGKRARAIFGGRVPGVVKNLCQTTHDLHLAEVYLRYRLNAPTQASAWVGEDEIGTAGSGDKIPDALLLDAAGVPARAVEFGGNYPPERLRALHEHCCRRHLPYEIW